MAVGLRTHINKRYELTMRHTHIDVSPPIRVREPNANAAVMGVTTAQAGPALHQHFPKHVDFHTPYSTGHA
jgi:hypothetical protein